MNMTYRQIDMIPLGRARKHRNLPSQTLQLKHKKTPSLGEEAPGRPDIIFSVYLCEDINDDSNVGYREYAKMLSPLERTSAFQH